MSRPNSIWRRLCRGVARQLLSGGVRFSANNQVVERSMFAWLRRSPSLRCSPEENKVPGVARMQNRVPKRRRRLRLSRGQHGQREDEEPRHDDKRGHGARGYLQLLLRRVAAHSIFAKSVKAPRNAGAPVSSLPVDRRWAKRPFATASHTLDMQRPPFPAASIADITTGHDSG